MTTFYSKLPIHNKNVILFLAEVVKILLTSNTKILYLLSEQS